MADVIDSLKAEFDALTVQHEAIVAQVETLRSDREVFNLQAIAAQEQANAITVQMQQIYDDSGFFEIARRRGKLADAIMSLKSQG